MVLDTSSGPLGNLDYRVAHGSTDHSGGKRAGSQRFLVVRDAGSGEADGVYKPGDRRWLDHDVYENRFGECIISREKHANRSGDVKHGFVLGRTGQPLYGTKTEKTIVPTKGWKCFQGLEPVPAILTFDTWSEACQNAAWYFVEEAQNAAKGGHWKVVLMMADRAFDCHTNARPMGRADSRLGGTEWSAQLCELLGIRADALLHLGQYKRALVDACAAVHFVPAFDWSRARTRGVSACLNLGVEEEQAKLLLDEMGKRSEHEFPGVKDLEPIVDRALALARGKQLKVVPVEDDVADDGRIYFRVVDPEECKLHAGPDRGARTLGSRDFNDIIRGKQLVKNGEWLELHPCEEHDDAMGHRKAYVPLFTSGADGEEREEILERLKPREYPRVPVWEQVGVSLRPIGLKPPLDVPIEYSRWRDPDRPATQKEWPFIYKHGLALAVMLRAVPDFVIDSFVRYHWITGWNHVYLFFDDPVDPGIAHARVLEEFCLTKKVEGVSISVILMDGEWWDKATAQSRFFLRRDKNDTYGAVCRAHEVYNDVSARRMIAVDMALLDAHDKGFDWFAHVDIDECVYVPKLLDNSARRYLGSLDRSVQCVRLWNHEVVPERLDCQDWLRECTLFQVNTQHCQGFKAPREYDEVLRQREGRDFEPEKQGAETKWWRQLLGKVHFKRQAAMRRLNLQLPPSLQRGQLDLEGLGLPMGGDPLYESFLSFSAYGCGKCVVRLDQRVRPAVPLGLHSFVADNGDFLKCDQASSANDPVVLHYPNASFQHWRDKYEHLGAVDPKRDSIEGVGHALRTHLASSQLVLERPRHLQELFYKTCIMQSEHNELAVMAEYGLVLRITGVKELLEFYDQPRDAPEVLPGQVELRDMNTGLKFGR